MAEYKVIKNFRDGQDNNRPYVKERDSYPREGLEPEKDRFELLLDKGFIHLIEDEPEETKENNVPTQEWTVPEIKKYLDDNNIEYKQREGKDTLLELAGG